jgi:diketogulonate reductase-like aldo/keto reductase
MRRGIEFDLLPYCRQHGISVMAYSPVEQGRLLHHPALQRIAVRHRATAAQIALAWIMRHAGVIAIPKASTSTHVRENRAALDITLSDQDLAALDSAFPAPTGPRPLEMI